MIPSTENNFPPRGAYTGNKVALLCVSAFSSQTTKKESSKMLKKIIFAVLLMTMTMTSAHAETIYFKNQQFGGNIKSPNSKTKDSTELLSFSWEVSNPDQSSDKFPKCNANSIQITKRPDNTSGKFVKASAMGENIRDVRIILSDEFQSSSSQTMETERVLMLLVLEDVNVQSFGSFHRPGQQELLEQISINYARIRGTFYRRDRFGKEIGRDVFEIPCAL